MTCFWIILGVALGLAALVLLTAYICFYMAFYVVKRKNVPVNEIETPEGEEVPNYRSQLTMTTGEFRALVKEQYPDANLNGPVSGWLSSPRSIVTETRKWPLLPAAKPL